MAKLNLSLSVNSNERLGCSEGSSYFTLESLCHGSVQTSEIISVLLSELTDLVLLVELS